VAGVVAFHVTRIVVPVGETHVDTTPVGVTRVPAAARPLEPPASAAVHALALAGAAERVRRPMTRPTAAERLTGRDLVIEGPSC
jgi:hypothetical protein